VFKIIKFKSVRNTICQNLYFWSSINFKMFEDRDIVGVDATVIVGILILTGVTTINLNILNN
jgi:hypothetical protein